MPKIIIGNVDNEHMVSPSAVTSESTIIAAVTAYSMIWLVEEGDILVTPDPISIPFLQYVCSLKKIDYRTIVLIPLSDNSNRPILITFDALTQPRFIEKLKKHMAQSTNWWLCPYFFDRSISWLAHHLHIPFGEKMNAFLHAGGAELLNSKAVFRRLCAGKNIPIPQGHACSSKAKLRMWTEDLLEETGAVMIKQDFNAGGFGNIALSLDSQVTSFPGASKTHIVSRKDSIAPVIDEIWAANAKDRNIELVVEVYHSSEHIYYSDFEAFGPGIMPKYLNHGQMRMEPLWVGFSIPGPLDPFLTAKMMAGSTALASLVSEIGYIGMINFDIVFTKKGDPLFLEFNGRCGGTTHIHTICLSMFGPNYAREFAFVTRNMVKAGSFNEVIQQLDAEGLLFHPSMDQGVIILAEDTNRTGTIDYLVAAKTSTDSLQLEERLLRLLKTRAESAKASPHPPKQRQMEMS